MHLGRGFLVFLSLGSTLLSIDPLSFDGFFPGLLRPESAAIEAAASTFPVLFAAAILFASSFGIPSLDALGAITCSAAGSGTLLRLDNVAGFSTSGSTEAKHNRA
jgi:hypothetical protein